jgi:hypothetical protein
MTTHTYTVAYSHRQHLGGLLHLSRQRSDHERIWHIWIGPVGLHVFWPDVRSSRPGWCRSWRDEEVELAPNSDERL